MITPLNKLDLKLRDHSSAIWWIGLAYCRPRLFNQAEKCLPRSGKIKSILFLLIHFLPYVLIIGFLGRLILYNIIGVKIDLEDPLSSNTFKFHFYHVIGAILFGALFGSVWEWVSIFDDKYEENISVGIISGVVIGVAFAISGGGDRGTVAFGIVHGIATGVVTGIMFGMMYQINRGIGAQNLKASTAVYGLFSILIGMIFRSYSFKTGAMIASLAAGVIANSISFIVCFLRIYYYPLHLMCVWPQARVRCYSKHPVAWDELCLVPFWGLHRLLVLLAEKSSHIGMSEIERLINTYPSQRMEALRAKTVLIARNSSMLIDLGQLDITLAQLPDGDKGFLSQTVKLRDAGNKICLLQKRLDTVNRPFLREPIAELLLKEIETFRNQIAGYREPLSFEFRAAASRWLDCAQRELEKIQVITKKEIVKQVFRAGDPVDREQEAFVVRLSVIGDLEQQLMLSTGCPGIVLYGRRRMGKSTLLRNLKGFLPENVLTSVISMQDPRTFTSLESFLHVIVKELKLGVPNFSLIPETEFDLAGLFNFLEVCNQCLVEGTRLILAIDEYEMIDKKISEKVFPAGLLDTIRESIESHRNITWIFAGSHEITELSNAAWTSYLVSARTIEVNPFTISETHLLLTEPLKYSSLWGKEGLKRPVFSEDFWGPGRIEAIHKEAGGWPHLVQLIAETIVDLTRDEETNTISEGLFHRALDKSVLSGHNVLHLLLRKESTLPGEWEYLKGFRRVETQPLPADDSIANSLRRRLLVEEGADGFRLRVPLMARWLKLRGILID